MKRAIAIATLTLALSAQATPALAFCTTHTIHSYDKGLIICRTCCFGNYCNTPLPSAGLKELDHE